MDESAKLNLEALVRWQSGGPMPQQYVPTPPLPESELAGVEAPSLDTYKNKS